MYCGDPLGSCITTPISSAFVLPRHLEAREVNQAAAITHLLPATNVPDLNYHVERSTEARDFHEITNRNYRHWRVFKVVLTASVCTHIAVKVETTAEAFRLLRIPRNRRLHTRAECYMRTVLKITAIVPGN